VTNKNNQTSRLSRFLFAAFTLVTPLTAAWHPAAVRQLNPGSTHIRIAARHQIVTETWNRVAAVPYIVYMPEQDRILMLVACDYPHQAMLLSSSDHGATWSAPRPLHVDAAGKPDTGMATSLTYLGQGRVAAATPDTIWFSNDFGQTWAERTPFPKTSTGLVFNLWDPLFAGQPAAPGSRRRILTPGYTMNQALYESSGTPGYSSGGLRTSTDEGLTWSDPVAPPEWRGINEVALARAANGDLVAACRTDWPKEFRKANLDHYEGLAVSISRTDGATWSTPNRLFAWGRHHPSLAVLPGGTIVMTYVVRKGYPQTPAGIPTFGIEALVSADNGRTWDFDHRYILAEWQGVKTGPNSWFTSSQSTSTVMLPDGSLLTAYGTGYRAIDTTGKGQPSPRDVGLVSWRLGTSTLRPDHTLSHAPWDSNIRNKFNPDGPREIAPVACPQAPGKHNLAWRYSAQAEASSNDGDARWILSDGYTQPVLTLQTMPAWVVVRWSTARRIDEIHILPGAPEWAGRPATECVPLDYRIQFDNHGTWADAVPPVTNAQRSRDFYGSRKAHLIQDREFEYIHKFPAVSTRAVRVHVTRSSDTGRSPEGPEPVRSDRQRETCLRAIEVFESRGR
jgi:hypothetical protein